MGHGQEVKTRTEPQVEIQERGEIFFFYRPKVDKEEAHSADDVQRLYIVLRPESGEQTVEEKQDSDSGKGPGANQPGGMQKQRLELFAVVAWFIWNRRNKIRLKEPSLDKEKIFSAAAQYLSDFQLKVPMKEVKAPTIKEKWSPPPGESYKTNYDGAVFEDTEEEGIGFEKSEENKKAMNSAVLLSLLFLFAGCFMATANVVLIVHNATFSFQDVEANFAPPVKGSGECGVLYMAEPLDACSTLTNKVEKASNCSSPFVLIVRGGCSFEDKVRRAQTAGFKAAIVYDNEDSGVLVAMAGNSAGVKINAVFVSKASVLATCFFVRRHRIRRERPRASRVREFHGMSSRLVKAMPSLIFTAVLEDNCTSITCAICLEDYTVGEKLRILPCRHKFHALCVDSWLTTWRTFCPVCKRDARTNTGDPPASESTPLLSASPASVASSVLSSMRSSFASSSAIQIAPASSQSPSVSHMHSVASTPYIQNSLRSYRQSPPMHVSRSSVDLRNASSQRSQAPHFISPHSLGYPSYSPYNSRFMSPYIPSPSSASPSFVSSSGHQQQPLHCSDICFVSSIGAAKSSPVGVEPTFLRSFLPQACTVKLLRHDWILFDIVACLHQFLCLEWNLLRVELVATLRVHCSIRFSFCFEVIIVVLSFEVWEVCLIKA
nr:receptor likey region, transmembrane domain- and ring domain-containing protein 2 [Quercus suber]